MGLDRAVSIATYCGVEGPTIQFHWGRYFRHPSRPNLGTPGSHIEHCAIVSDSLSQCKRAGSWPWHPYAFDSQTALPLKQETPHMSDKRLRGHTYCLVNLRKQFWLQLVIKPRMLGFSASISVAIPTEPSGTTRMNIRLDFYECVNYSLTPQGRNLLLLIACLWLYWSSVLSAIPLSAAALKCNLKLRP